MAVTHQKVGAVLRKAGFTRTRPLRAGIIGLYDYTEGYKVWTDPGGPVYVEHELPITGARRPNSAERRQQALAKYAEALAAAGVACETRERFVVCR